MLTLSYLCVLQADFTTTVAATSVAFSDPALMKTGDTFWFLVAGVNADNVVGPYSTFAATKALVIPDILVVTNNRCVMSRDILIIILICLSDLLDQPGIVPDAGTNSALRSESFVKMPKVFLPRTKLPVRHYRAEQMPISAGAPANCTAAGAGSKFCCGCIGAGCLRDSP